MEPLLDTAEVAAQLRTSEHTVRYWRQQGTGPRGFKVGRRVLYPESEVRAWLETQRLAEMTRNASA